MALQPPCVPAWDDAALGTAERRLARFVGPMARILVRQAAAQAHDARDLYALLGEHIADAQERARFVAQGVPADASGSHTRRASAQADGSPATRPVAAQSSGSRVRTPRPLEQAFVDQTTSRLAVYLGPIAKVVARKAAEQARDTDDFVRLVAEHIGTQERNAFLREIASGES